MSSPRTRSAVVGLVITLAVATALWYVTAPPKGLDGYRERAASIAEAVRSQVETSRLWVRTVEDGKATHAAALVGLREAEEDARSAASTFQGYEPPAKGLPLRRAFSAVTTDATAALAELRIAAEQGRWEGIAATAEPLSELSTRLRRFEERAEP